MFKQLTDRGLEVTGYELFASDLKGAFLRWGYEHRGIATYLNEVWSLAEACAFTGRQA